MQHYIINNPIGRLGNHIITYLNIIYLHHLLYCKNNTSSSHNIFKITLNNNHHLLKHNIQLTLTNYNASGRQNTKDMFNTKVSRLENNNILPGYSIFHIQDILNNKLQSKHHICFYDYFNIASTYLSKLWNITSHQYNEFQSIYKTIILDNYINLDNTLCIHIKCTDNTDPAKIIHKKYNIYPNKYYLDICNIYNYNTICICTDNPKHIIITNLIQHAEKRGINVINISKLTDDMMMDFYFLACAKNILVDNSTFTFMSAIHPTFINENGFTKNKTIFLYKDFFSRFLLDIRTNEWDKNILDFCINNLDNFQHIIKSNVLIYNEIEFFTDTYSSPCNCNRKINTNTKENYTHKLIVFEVNINSEFNSNNATIKIGDWIGNEKQIRMLLLE